MRWFLRTLLVFAIPYGQLAAQEQSYPSRPITIVVPYPAGGATDVIARSVAQRLSTVWDRAIIVENKGGASTQIGAAQVAKAPPDGYTLLATDATTFTNSYLYSSLSYNPQDFVPVTGLGVIHQALVVHPSFPAHNVTDLIALAKKEPDTLTYATLGVGSSSHLSMEMLESKTGMKLRPVHYKGGAPALTDVIGGHVPMVFLSMTLVAQPSKAGQLRLLGIGSTKRLPQFPELPTIAETVASYEAAVWFGLFAPAGTPRDIVATLNTHVQDILTDREFRSTFLDPNFYEPLLGSPGEFGRFAHSDAAKWGAVMREAKLELN
ncbi:MAG TPA: tripartite tricarboxylate transporter substrate binding protein [Terracidiphilus sp.]